MADPLPANQETASERSRYLILLISFVTLAGASGVSSAFAVFVSVHLVGTRNTCQPTPMSRTIAVHEYRASFLPGAVGPDPSCGPGLHPCPRSPCGGVGGHRPAVGSDGPAHNRAAAARLAHLVAASVERSTPGPRQAATARTQWAS